MFAIDICAAMRLATAPVLSRRSLRSFPGSLRLLALVALALSLPQCSCGSSYPRDQLGAEIQPDAAALRLSNSLFQLMQRHLESILRQSFETDPSGEYAIIYIPEAADGPTDQFCDELNRWPGVVPACTYPVRMRDGCIGPGTPDLSGRCTPDLGYPRATYRSFVKVRIADLVDNLDIAIEPATLLDQGSIRIRIRNLLLDGSLGMFIDGNRLANANVGLGAITCQFTKAPGSPHMLRIDEIDVSVQPLVARNGNGQPTLTSTALVRAVKVSGLSLTASPLPTDQACVTASGLLKCDDACKLAGDILELGSNAFNAVNDVIAPALPYIATPVANALMLAFANKPLELGGPIPLGDLPVIPKGAARDLWLMTSAGEGAFKVTQKEPGRSEDPTLGFTLPMWAGAFAANSPCAPPTAPPLPYASQLPVFDGTVKLDHPLAPGTTYNEQYHLAMMISQSYLNQIAFAARNSGLFCAEVGSQGEGLLSSGAFVPTAGLLFLLAPPLERLAQKDAPIMLKLKPGLAPRIELGNGAIIGRDDNGRPIRNSLINLYLSELGLEFHLFSFDRFVRTFVLNVDIVVSASVNIGKNGKLGISIDSIKAERITEQFNELFPGYDFSKVTEVIFSVFASQLSPESLSFDLPLNAAIQDALGSDELEVRMLALRRDGPSDDLLAAYIKICDNTSKADASDIACFKPTSTPARNSLVENNPITAHVISTEAATHGDPMITLALNSGHSDDWQYSVDGGPYSRVTGPDPATGLIKVRHPLLAVMGKHRVSLHRVGDEDSQVTQVEVWLDPNPPSLRFDSERGWVANDDVTPTDRLLMQIDDEPFVSFEQASLLPTRPGQRARVKDLGGNISSFVSVPAPQNSEPSTAARGCSAASARGAPNGAAGELLFSAALMVLALHRVWRKNASH